MRLQVLPPPWIVLVTALVLGASAFAETDRPEAPAPVVETIESAGESPDVAGHRSRLELAIRQRAEGQAAQAAQNLATLLASDAPEEIHRSALFELGLLAQEQGHLARAQQIFAQYTARYAQHPTVVEAYLRHGEVHRSLGARTLALAKFYAVMTSALSLRLDQLEHYQKLVLQAQVEIAETHYQDGRWSEAVDFLTRLLKLDSPFLDRAQIQFKLIRALAMQNRQDRIIAQAQRFLDEHPDSPDLPEVRFTMARSLMALGRKDEALRQVLLLLEAQRAGASERPEAWAYWQKRAGNEIGNQLYQEGDFLGTLVLYERLAEVDDTASWQVPVWYQIGLVLERLQQTAKAREMYGKVLAREPEIRGTNATPSLTAVMGMARWRRDNLAWFENATAATDALRQGAIPPETASATPAQP